MTVSTPGIKEEKKVSEWRLRNLKINQSMSDETTCFSASLYQDGKRIGTVCNRGYGAPHEYDIMRAAEKALDEHVATLELPFEFERRDQFIDQLLGEEEEAAQLRRWCKKGTVVHVAGDGPNDFLTYKAPFSETVKKILLERNPKIDEFINERFAS